MSANPKIKQLYVLVVAGVLSALLIASASMIVLGWWPAQRQQATHNAEVVFTELWPENARLTQIFEAYSQSLFGVRAFMASHGETTRRDWRIYFQNLSIARRLPGLGALVYAEQVPRSQKSAFEAAQQRDPVLIADGITNFQIYPDENQDVFQAITYMEPPTYRNLRNSLGFDLSSEPNRRLAIEKARASNQVVTTPPVQLIGSEQPGYILILPIYDTRLESFTPLQRQEAYRGLVIASIRVKELFDQLFAGFAAENIRVTVYDGPEVNPEQQIYTNDHQPRTRIIGSQLVTASRTYALADRSLTVELTGVVATTPVFLFPALWLRLVILIATNLLTAVICWYVLRRFSDKKLRA